MRTFKIITTLLLAVTSLLWACDDPNYVPRAEYENLVAEYADLQASAEATRAEYAQQAAAVDNILQQLSQISGRTVTLRANLEQGTAQLTQVQQIEQSITDIKEQLAELDKISRQSAELGKMVKSLQAVIAQKDTEIQSLKEEISRRDATIDEQHRTIKEQSGTIESQMETISAQKENLRALLAEQAQMLFQAGVDFEDLGDNTPTVRGRKDKRNQQDFRRAMYEKSIIYYRQAQSSGYPEAAYRITVVQEKIAAE